jgi:hypothetical protein
MTDNAAIGNGEFCVNCGARIVPAEAEFCSACGIRITSMASDEPAAAGGDGLNDATAMESEPETLAPETEVALEVSRRMPMLLMVAIVLLAIVCWRRMHKDDVTA